MNNAPKMHRAHFRFIAETIANMPDHTPSLHDQKVSTANAFANALHATNHLFNRDRFIQACNLPETN